MPTLKQQFQFRKRRGARTESREWRVGRGERRGNRCQLTHGERQERINNLNCRSGVWGVECGAHEKKESCKSTRRTMQTHAKLDSRQLLMLPPKREEPQGVRESASGRAHNKRCSTDSNQLLRLRLQLQLRVRFQLQFQVQFRVGCLMPEQICNVAEILRQA